MKINLTKKEYRLLMEMLYLSNWMMNSNAVEPEERHQQHEELRKKLLSYSKEMQADDIIERFKESNEYYETKEQEEYLHNKFIDPYEDHIFWQELIDRLAERDVVKELGLEALKAMDGMDRIMKIEEVREQYANEFQNHGLEYVKINHGSLVKS